MKYEYKLSVDAEMATKITKAYERFKAAGRRVCRNDVIVQLIDDGFRMWQRESDVVGRLEVTVASLSDQLAKQDRMLRSILLTLAEGDEDEYREVISKIEKEEKINV